jgi:hypothetical protein
MRRRYSVLLALAAVAIGAFPGSAQAAVTIGTDLGWPADESTPGCLVACTVVNTAVPAADMAPDGLASPVNGIVTGWRFKTVTAGGSVSLRVLRPAGGMSFTGVSTSAVAVPISSAMPQGPFPTSLPIRIGDHVGLNASAGQTVIADTPATQLYWNSPPLADGETRTGTTGNREPMVQAIVEPTNTVSFGAITRHKKKGTATVTMTVPNPGTLSYGGFCAKVAGPSSVATPGDVQLIVKACGKQRKRLGKKGKVRIAFNVGFTPNSGQFGATNELLTLRKKLKK